MELKIPQWFYDLLNQKSLEEGREFQIAGQVFVVQDQIPRSRKLLSAAQDQTSKAFGYKWKQRETFDSAASLARMHDWLVERYGDPTSASWFAEHGDQPLLVDAGCGAGMSAIELFGAFLPRTRYLGIDVSEAVNVARDRFAERGLPGGFLQADITTLPIPPRCVDLIFSEGVLHHTNSTELSLKSLAQLLKCGGRFLFYVYRRKGPIREFTDDFVRERLRTMDPDAGWKAIEPLTQLGISLGSLDAEIDIPQPIDLLGIPAGRMSIQRFFYWHVAKAFYRPDLSFAEMNHINFDWFAPTNAHRQSPEEVRHWCAEAGLEIEREVVEDAGITIVARKS